MRMDLLLGIVEVELVIDDVDEVITITGPRIKWVEEILGYQTLNKILL